MQGLDHIPVRNLLYDFPTAAASSPETKTYTYGKDSWKFILYVYYNLIYHIVGVPNNNFQP